MSKRKDPNEQLSEQLEAYGEYTYDQQPAQSEAAAVRRAQKKHKRRRDQSFFRFLLFLSVALVALILVMENYFTLEVIYVVGNEERTPEEIILRSGLVSGRNMLGIEESEVAASFAMDHTIVFKGMQKQYPNTIYIYVEERKTVASLQWLGMLYTLDPEGLVMEKKNSSTLPPGLPVVTGLNASNVTVGEQLVLKDQRQLVAYQRIMYELYQQQCASEFSEVSLNDPDNVFLVTVEGVTVRAGDTSNMRAKIGAVRTTMAYLRQIGKTGGILDVTTPQEPKYMPEN